jgi:ArsR family transcriptional regulator
MKEKDKSKKKSDKKKNELKEKKIPKSEKKKKGKKKQKEEFLLQKQALLQESAEALEEQEALEALPEMEEQEKSETSAVPQPVKRVTSKPSVQTHKKISADTGKTETADASVSPAAKRDSASREAQALIFRALGDEIRLQILEFLEEREMCAADILKLLPIVQSTLSHHMKILCEAQLVLCRREGRWSYYVLNKPIFQEAAAQLIERSK